MTQATHEPFGDWSLARDEHGIAWLTFTRPDETVNALSPAALDNLLAALDLLAAQPPRGLIVQSGKPGQFIVGADIGTFSSIDSPDAARAFISQGWRTLQKLARAPYPTLALVRGTCLGGGLELALACRYRVLVDDPATILGLPEAMLGIVPAWGGMRRLPALIGPVAALDLMVGGKRLDARRAKRAGLADLMVAERVMQASARGLLLSGQPAAQPGLLQRVLNRSPFKALVAHAARRKIAQRDPYAHYPAPRAIVDIWEKHDGDPLADPATVELLFFSGTARNLLRVFTLQTRLKSLARADDGALITHVHVIGAGAMGGDIAAWCAYKGLTVSLQDTDRARIDAALGRAARLFDRRLGGALAARAASDRLIPDVAGDGLRRADVVIEAIAENADAKCGLYRQIEPMMKPDAILASNTSSLSLAQLAEALQRPDRLAGIHFFNPAAKMPLVEVVRASRTSPATDARARAFAGRIDKLVLPVEDTPGFLVNAALAPYLEAAMRCVDQGMAVESIDESMLAFGMPMGPLEMADTVGLDIALAAGRQLNGTHEPPRCLIAHTEKGELGRKTGRGFYTWVAGRAKKTGKAAAIPGVADSLSTVLEQAVRRLVADGVVADADLADAGLIFGAGFAPFTGGPLHHQDRNTGI